MKKFLTLCLSFCLLIGCCFCLSACGNVDKPKTYNVSLVAHYTFQYNTDSNGNETIKVIYKEPKTIKVNENDLLCNYTLPDDPTDLVNTDIHFVGWYTEKDYVYLWNPYTDRINSDLTLYAKYEYRK